MSAEREVWTEDDQRFLHVDYENGVATVSREAMRHLLTKAGFRETEEPPETQFNGGRERLRHIGGDQ